MTFPDHLRQIRSTRGFSLREVATQIGVDPAYLSRVEAGKVRPSVNLLARLAALLGCPAEELSLLAGRLPRSVQDLLEREPQRFLAALQQIADGAVAASPASGKVRKGLRRSTPVGSSPAHASYDDPDAAGLLDAVREQQVLYRSQRANGKRSPDDGVLIPASASASDPRNSLNDLTAREWIPETVSVWIQRGLGAGHPDAQIERQHPAPFSFTDVGRLIRFFTKRGELVLDPFVGVGSTLKACAIDGRHGIGFELNKRYSLLARQRLATEVRGSPDAATQQKLQTGDARLLASQLHANSVDFVVTSPPYWSILHKEDHKAKQERKQHDLDTRYGNDPRDLGNIRSYTEFLDQLASILGDCGRALRPGRYMAVIVSDFRHKSRFFMFHADLATALQQRGLGLRGITVLYQRHKRVFPYGYPFAYVPNVHHQYILIHQKER